MSEGTLTRVRRVLMTASLVFFGVAGPVAIGSILAREAWREQLIAMVAIYLANAPIGIAVGRRWRETWLLLVPFVGVVWMWHNAWELTGGGLQTQPRTPAGKWSGGQ